jgi:ferredoxin
MRHYQNAEGQFWIDQDECVGCQVCVGDAPVNITFDSTSGKSYVFKQPETADELHGLSEAVILCPIGAVKRDEL